MVCDVSRAFFYAPVQHELFVEQLRMSVYGAKAAAQNWHQKVQETMATLGFSIGKASPALLSFPEKFEMSCARR